MLLSSDKSYIFITVTPKYTHEFVSAKIYRNLNSEAGGAATCMESITINYRLMSEPPVRNEDNPSCPG